MSVYDYEDMVITIRVLSGYDGPYYHWKVITNSTGGFVLCGKEDSYRRACKEAKRAMKRLAGIGYLPYERVQMIVGDTKEIGSNETLYSD